MKDIILSGYDAYLVNVCISYFIYMFKDSSVPSLFETDFNRLVELKSELEK